MAKKDEVEHEPLTEEQRITALESRVGTNKVVLLVMALILIVVISVSITIITFSAFEEETEVVEAETVADLQQLVSQLSNQNEALAKEMKGLKKTLLVVEDQLGNTSNFQMVNLTLKEEQANQEFLDALRSGMFDLAHMLPGSRTWLDVYGEKVNKAIMLSEQREKDLERLLNASDSQDKDDLW